MTTISPSVLSCDFTNVEKELKLLEKSENIWVHLDVMDGHFVPNLTFGPPLIRQMAKKTTLPLDAHFMVTNPEFHLEELKDTELENFTFHIETVEDSLGLIRKYRSFYKSLGVSIKPNTPVSDLSDELLKELDLVLVMSVEPGFGGQSFIESAYDKIEELVKRRKELNTNFVIQIDGGVKKENSKKIIEAGADNLVAGSFVFKVNEGETYDDRINQLR